MPKVSRAALSGFISIAALLLGCPPDKRPSYQTNAVLSVDAVNKRAFTILPRYSFTQAEATSALVAVSLEDGKKEKVVGAVEGNVSIDLSPSLVVLTTDQKLLLFDRQSLSARGSVDRTRIRAFSRFLDLAVTTDERLIDLGRQHFINAVPRPNPTALFFLQSGQGLLSLSCPPDGTPRIRVRTWSTDAVLHADALGQTAAPTQDFQIEVKWAGGVGGCPMDAYISPDDTSFVTTLMHAVVVVNLIGKTSITLNTFADGYTTLDAVGFSGDSRTAFIPVNSNWLEVDLQTQTVVNRMHPESRRSSWGDYRLYVGTISTNDFVTLVYDNADPALGIYCNPPDHCALRGNVFWDVGTELSGYISGYTTVDMMTGVTTPVMFDSLRGSVSDTYVPMLDRILVLRTDPSPALDTVRSDNGAIEKSVDLSGP